MIGGISAHVKQSDDGYEYLEVANICEQLKWLKHSKRNDWIIFVMALGTPEEIGLVFVAQASAIILISAVVVPK